MKSVLISIQPKWCELIALGKKTVEVRKTRPKIETPFKCYIYQTKGKEKLLDVIKDGDSIYGDTYHGKTVFVKTNEKSSYGLHGVYGGEGKVIGEFVCDEITPLFNVATTSWNLLAGNVHEYAKSLVRMARLTEEEMHSYAKRKNCYAWHITDLKIYRKPRELSEFLVSGNQTFDYPPLVKLKRPPQSWCYVEGE